MQDLLSFIPQHLLILIVATYVVGVFLKRSSFKDNHITIALMLFCITFSFLLTIINAEYKRLFDAAVNSFLQGILCWGVSVGLNQTYKQLKKEE